MSLNEPEHRDRARAHARYFAVPAELQDHFGSKTSLFSGD
jgi:hypothetical protein